jgi:hypothetical protein
VFWAKALMENIKIAASSKTRFIVFMIKKLNSKGRKISVKIEGE